MTNPSEKQVGMNQDTDRTPVRVSLNEARDSATRLRAALGRLGVHADDTRQIIPASDADGGYHIRMGTWDPGSADALADGIEAIATAPQPAP